MLLAGLCISLLSGQDGMQQKCRDQACCDIKEMSGIAAEDPFCASSKGKQKAEAATTPGTDGQSLTHRIPARKGKVAMANGSPGQRGDGRLNGRAQRVVTACTLHDVHLYCVAATEVSLSKP